MNKNRIGVLILSLLLLIMGDVVTAYDEVQELGRQVAYGRQLQSKETKDVREMDEKDKKAEKPKPEFPMKVLYFALGLIFGCWCLGTCCKFNFEYKKCHLACPASCSFYLKNLSPCA